MIQFTLKCDHDHRFDSWFQSSEAYDKLAATGMVACSICGSTSVAKAPMAPRVQTSRPEVRPQHADQPPRAPAPAGAATTSAPSLRAPSSDAERAIAELRRKVEENATYVGGNFAREARAMHEGGSPDRPIYGEAKPEEARALIEDGVPVLPLPFAPGRKTN